MKDDNHNQDEQNTSSASGREFAARRTIVKGMASAVPVVMTIGCGQAMAQTSTLNCIVENPVPMPEHCLNPNATESPIYQREAATQQECNDTDPNRTSVATSDPMLYGDKGTVDHMYGDKGAPDQMSATSSNKYLSGGTSYDSKGFAGETMEHGFFDTTSSGNKRRLVYVDANGKPVSSASGSPVTASCYASFIVPSSQVSYDAFGNKGSSG